MTRKGSPKHIMPVNGNGAFIVLNHLCTKLKIIVESGANPPPPSMARGSLATPGRCSAHAEQRGGYQRAPKKYFRKEGSDLVGQNLIGTFALFALSQSFNTNNCLDKRPPFSQRAVCNKSCMYGSEGVPVNKSMKTLYK